MSRYHVEFDAEGVTRRTGAFGKETILFKDGPMTVYEVPARFCTEIPESCAATMRLMVAGGAWSHYSCDRFGPHEEHASGTFRWAE